MTLACVICEHPKRAEIDAATAHGAIPRYLPGRYGVKKVDIERHLGHLIDDSLALTPSDAGPPYANRPIAQSSPATLAMTPSEPDTCRCDWCRASSYRRLVRAWDEATPTARERFCAETQTPEWV